MTNLEKTLKRIEDLLTALVKVKLAETIKAQLKDKNYRTLYELTGKLSVREVSRKTGFSLGKISGTWQKWEECGLIVKDGSKYRRIL